MATITGQAGVDLSSDLAHIYRQIKVTLLQNN